MYAAQRPACWSRSSAPRRPPRSLDLSATWAAPFPRNRPGRWPRPQLPRPSSSAKPWRALPASAPSLPESAPRRSPGRILSSPAPRCSCSMPACTAARQRYRPVHAAGSGSRPPASRLHQTPARSSLRCVPTTPPPIMHTRAGGTPGTPPSRIPRPPFSFSR